jgi:hypothetical protein
VQPSVRAVHVDAADRHDPARYAHEYAHDGLRFILRYEDHIQHDLGIEAPECARKISQAMPLAVYVCDVTRQGSFCLAAVKERHPVMHGSQARDDVWGNECCSSDDQNPHGVCCLCSAVALMLDGALAQTCGDCKSARLHCSAP